MASVGNWGPLRARVLTPVVSGGPVAITGNDNHPSVVTDPQEQLGGIAPPPISPSDVYLLKETMCRKTTHFQLIIKKQNYIH